MKTGSLRARVILSTLAVLAIVLAVVVTAVTLAYRAKLDGDLHTRLANAGSAVERAGSPVEAKRLLPGLALEGIALRFGGAGAPATAPANGGPTIRTHGSLLVLHETLSDGTQVFFSASQANIDHAVTEPAPRRAPGRGRRARTRHLPRPPRHPHRPAPPLRRHRDGNARRQGDSKLRLKPSRTDTELGSLAAAFDQMLDALETAIDEASASDAATRRFLADASHGSATPSPPSKQASKPSCANNPSGPSATASKRPSPATANDLAASSATCSDSARLEAQPNRGPTDLASITRPPVDTPGPARHTRPSPSALTTTPP